MGKLPTQTNYEINRDRITFDDLRARLKLQVLEAKRTLFEKHPKANKFLKEKGLDLGKIRQHSAKLLGSGAIAGALLLQSPQPTKTLPAPLEIIEKLKIKSNLSDQENLEKSDSKKLLVDILNSVLAPRPRPLMRNEEKLLEIIFQNLIGVSTRASLEGEHLNTTYGIIGIEQHLRRYPGDALIHHGKGEILTEGLARGLGAWGYFASSKDALTPDLEEIEKWYAVIQTLYLPDWNKRQPFLKDWYKYRKVLIVNTENGNAVVAAIADAGPAAWTGKNFGGSPEVMVALGGVGFKKGPVIVFFVDDPENKVPLGPVSYK